MVEFRRGRHCVFSLHVHLVFVTKYRRGVLTPEALDWLKTEFAKVCAMQGALLDACDGEEDHVHLLVNIPPTLAVSALVNALKGASSRRLRNEFPKIARRYWKGVLWTPSYFACSTGGATLEKVKQYVESQRHLTGGGASSPA